MSVAIAGRWTNYEVAFTWIEDVEALHVACAFDLKVPARRRGDVQKLIRQALAGTEGASVDEFDIQYARGRTGAPPPNDAVCYPRHVRFAVTGNEAGYACKAEMSVKGAALSLKCEPTAG